MIYRFNSQIVQFYFLVVYSIDFWVFSFRVVGFLFRTSATMSIWSYFDQFQVLFHRGLIRSIDLLLSKPRAGEVYLFEL